MLKLIVNVADVSMTVNRLFLCLYLQRTVHILHLAAKIGEPPELPVCMRHAFDVLLLRAVWLL